MNELFPVVSGVLAGLALTLVAPRLRPALGVLAATLLGIAATVLSGEWRISWEFLLLDIPLVGVSALGGFALARVLPGQAARRTARG